MIIKNQEKPEVLTREERVREIQKFTLLSDVFMSVALEDIPACEHVLRIFTGKRELTLRRVKTQYSISKIATKSVRLDVLAKDICGALYAIEVQRKASVDHARRVRFYSAMTDSSLLGKGEGYSGMPDRYIFYVSETDIWKVDRTVCHVSKSLTEGQKSWLRLYEDGSHVTYINAQVDDGSEVAALMRYFKTADPEDDSQGALSRRVKFLKSEEGGVERMCELTDMIEKRGELRGENRGRQEGKRVVAINLAGMGMTVDRIAQAVEENVSVVRQWLSAESLSENR